MNLLLVATLVAAWASATGGTGTMLAERQARLLEIDNQLTGLRYFVEIEAIKPALAPWAGGIYGKNAAPAPPPPDLSELSAEEREAGQREERERVAHRQSVGSARRRIEGEYWVGRIRQARAGLKGDPNLEDLRAATLATRHTTDLNAEELDAEASTFRDSTVPELATRLDAAIAADPELGEELYDTGRMLPQEFPQYHKRVLDLVADFESDYATANARDSETIAHVVERLEPNVKVPALDVDIPASRAVTIIAVGACAVLLYLFSAASALNAIAEEAEPGEGMDWIFFHPGRLGLGLGILWLLSPNLVLLFFVSKSVWNGTDRAGWFIIVDIAVLVVLATLAVLIWQQVRQARRKIHARLRVQPAKKQASQAT